MNIQQDDLISVIVPIYNVEKYLEKCIESIRNQAYKNLEIILVDDGSTDSSSELCDGLALKDNRIRIIHKKNGGLSDARNAGMKIAKGSYFAFIDSDDYIEPDMIESLYLLAVERNCQITIANMKRIYDDGSTDTFYEPVSFPKCLEGNIRFDTLNQPSVCNKLFKACLFNGIKFPKGRFYEDTFVYHELAYRAERIGFTGKQGYWYFSRKGSILGREQYTVRYFDFLEAVAQRMHFLMDHKVDEYGKEACLSYYAAYASALKYIKPFRNSQKFFNTARKEYLYAYSVLMKSADTSVKQRIRLVLLKYLPRIHKLIY